MVRVDHRLQCSVLTCCNAGCYTGHILLRCLARHRRTSARRGFVLPARHWQGYVQKSVLSVGSYTILMLAARPDDAFYG